MNKLRLLITVLILTVFTSVASAQSFVRLQTAFNSGTIDANGDEVQLNLVSGDTQENGLGIGSLKVQTLDSYSGTWEVQCSLDGTTFDTDNELGLQLVDTSSVAYSVSDTVGIWDVVNASACRKVRVVATAGFAASDTVVWLTAVQTGGSGGSGGGSSFDGVLLDAAAGDPITDTSNNALRVNVVTGTVTSSSDDQQAEDDNIAYGLTIPAVANLNYCDNGTNWERCAASLVTEITEDAAETAGAVGYSLFSVRRDTAASSAGASGDNATINTDSAGMLWTRFRDPCSGVAKVSVPIDIVTATTTEIIDASASNKAYICSINLHTNAANNVALVEDDTDACGSPTAGMAGGVTAAEGWNFGANGGTNFGSGGFFVAVSAATNRNVCLITSANTQLSGVITYVLAP